VKTLLGMSLVGMTLALLCVGASAQSGVGRLPSEMFQQLAELTGSQPYALYASSVALTGNTLVVGTPVATPPDGCVECGAAYVYTAVNGDWTNLQLTATLTQSSGQSLGGFGGAVAISGNTIVVGGYDFGTFEGAAYVYVSPVGTVTEAAELTTSGAPSGPFDSVSIDGSTIVAGSPLSQVGSQKELGAAYIYVEPPGGWANMTQTAELVASDAYTDCEFGTSVSISGHAVAIGAPRAQLAYVFVDPAGGWNGTQAQTAELEPSNGTKAAGFGVSLSLSGNTVGVGAPGQNVGSNQEQGAVYIFARPSGGWPKTMTQTAELTAARGTAGSLLGYSVAISGGTLFTGAPYVHSDQGLAYVFSEPPGGWRNEAAGEEVAVADGSPNNLFGSVVAIGGGVLGVSAPYWPDGGLTPDGAVYVFGESQ
jgi:hypothetical protein